MGHITDLNVMKDEDDQHEDSVDTQQRRDADSSGNFFENPSLSAAQSLGLVLD